MLAQVANARGARNEHSPALLRQRNPGKSRFVLGHHVLVRSSRSTAYSQATQACRCTVQRCTPTHWEHWQTSFSVYTCGLQTNFLDKYILAQEDHYNIYERNNLTGADLSFFHHYWSTFFDCASKDGVLYTEQRYDVIAWALFINGVYWKKKTLQELNNFWIH